MNNDKFEFTAEEREECLAILEKLKTTIGDSLKSDDEEKIRESFEEKLATVTYPRLTIDK